MTHFLRSISIAACLLCCIPQNGTCAAENPSKASVFINDLLDKADRQDPNPEIDFNAMIEIITEAENPLQGTKDFLQTLVDEVNVRYGLALTMEDYYQLLRQNLPFMQLSSDMEKLILIGIDALESGSDLVIPEELLNDPTENNSAD